MGREAVVPQSGRRIKIIADEYVDREFGTGALKITPGGCLQRWKGWASLRRPQAGRRPAAWVGEATRAWAGVVVCNQRGETVRVHARALDPAPLTPASLTGPPLLTDLRPLPQATT